MVQFSPECLLARLSHGPRWEGVIYAGRSSKLAVGLETWLPDGFPLRVGDTRSYGRRVRAFLGFPLRVGDTLDFACIPR